MLKRQLNMCLKSKVEILARYIKLGVTSMMCLKAVRLDESPALRLRLGEGSGTPDQGGAASDGGAKSGEGCDSEAKE